MRTAIIGLFCVLASATTATAATVVQWGMQDDVPVPEDFDSDRLADYVVWRPSTGTWFVRTSVTDAMWWRQWGVAGDVPVPADFDDDGRPDYVVWRPSTGTWFVRTSITDAMWSVQWGQANDVPLPGDYDADGKVDYAVWRPGTGEWFVLNNARTATWVQVIGVAGDLPFAGDVDGVPGDDYSVVHRNPPHAAPSQWLSVGGTTHQSDWTSHWILVFDRPTAARLCSDTLSKTFWRSTSGAWITDGQPTELLGQSGDIPVPANYAGDWSHDLAVWRPSDGTWHVEQSACDRWTPVRTRMEAATQHANGVTVAAVKDGAIVFADGAGMANDTLPAGPDVPWQLASISKLFIGTAIMTAVDSGAVDLDAPTGLVNPFRGIEPTLRQFHNHSSTVGSHASFGSLTSDPPRSLAAVYAILRKKSAWIDADPGTVGAYSNTGAAWPAYYLETVTGIDFDSYTRHYIFDQLGMTSTGWFMTDFASPQDLAIGYWADGTKTNEHGVWPYPMGNLRSSANDLALFMIMWTTGGYPVLSSTSVDAALQIQGVTGFGVNWARSSTSTGRVLWGHGGVFAGVCTRLNIDPVNQDGVVILTNGPCSVVGGDINAIEDRAFRILDEL